MEALTSTAASNIFPSLEGNVNCIALFNHEEIGSVSTNGAESSLIPTLLHRLSPTPATLAQSISRSFLISSDMGHAVHPSYTSKHEENHAPRMNGGIVIKTNAKQKYASDSIGSFIVRKLVERKGGKVQEYEVRNDMFVYICPSVYSISDPHILTGPVVPQSAPSCQRPVFVWLTLVVQCCRCTPFVKQQGHTMCRMLLTYLRHSSKVLSPWIVRTFWWIRHTVVFN